MENVNLITRNDLCISCGACLHACPYKEIEIKINARKGFYEPVISNESTCIICSSNACLKVCPSYEENFIELANWTDESQKIGPYYSLYTGYSTESDIRIKASSGGIIKELCRFYLETNKIDGVITLAHIAGLEYEPVIYDTVESVIGTPGSIYHNINFEKAIEIIKTTKGRFAIVATPCQLTAIKKWGLLYPEQMVGEIVVTIGLICGWMFTHHSLDHFSRSTGIEFSDLQDVTYRGGDKFGELMLYTGSNTTGFSRRPKMFRHSHTSKYKIAFSRTYNNKRCLLCVEHLNYLADISVGDAWLDAFKHNKIGVSILVVRKNALDITLREIEGLGRIVINHATEDDVIESQSEDLALGISAQRTINKLRIAKKFVPEYIRPLAIREMPTFDTWYRTYLYPGFFRYLTWNGFGYQWFKVRVFFYPISYVWMSIVQTVKSLPRKGLTFLAYIRARLGNNRKVN